MSYYNGKGWWSQHTSTSLSDMKNFFNNIGNWMKETFDQFTGKANVIAQSEANQATLASNEKINDQQLAIQKEINDSNIQMQTDFNNQNIALAQDAAAFEKEKFAFNQYLNENQNQIAANDRSKAGLNPIGQANLSTVGVGSMPSGINGSAPQAQFSAQLNPTNFIAGMYDTSFMSNAMISGLNRWTAKENNRLAKDNLDIEKLKLELEKSKLQELIRSNKSSESNTRYSIDLSKETALINVAAQLVQAGVSVEDINALTGLNISSDMYERLKNMEASQIYSNYNSSSSKTVDYILEALGIGAKGQGSKSDDTNNPLFNPNAPTKVNFPEDWKIWRFRNEKLNSVLNATEPVNIIRREIAMAKANKEYEKTNHVSEDMYNWMKKAKPYFNSQRANAMWESFHSRFPNLNKDKFFEFMY